MSLRRHLFLSGILLFALIGGTINAQQTATGTVFLDQNNNGQMDSGEKGIAGVSISNGEQVTQTHQNGTYSLQINSKEDKIFVIKPSGYHLPTDSLNRTQFYYIHKPNGSPDLKYEGMAPTGELPDSINFPLLPGEENNQYKALLFGDPQPYGPNHLNYFRRDIISELQNAENYAFGITLGDLVGNDLDLFTPYSKAVNRVGIPWFNVYGNHDMNFDATSDKYADETYEAHFGPATYAFNYGKTHYIILDNVIYPRPGNKSGYIGGFTDEQLNFVKNDLNHIPKDRLVVVAFHIPIPKPDKNGRKFRIEDRNRLFELLDDYPHTLSLSAHSHTQNLYFFNQQQGWGRPEPHLHYNVGTTSGDWWSGMPGPDGIPHATMRDGTPNGYGILNVEGNSFTFDYKVADKPEDYKMSIWGPEVVPQDSWHNADLYVNYFLGSKYTKVKYRVREQTGWKSMNKIKRGDPKVAAYRFQWDTADTVLAGKRPSNPVNSSHLWKTGIPNDLPLGEHVIEIRIQDIFGRTFADQYRYEVVDPKQ